MNAFNKDGLTPLQLAAKTDNCEALAILLEHGAKVEACSLQGSRAIHIAAAEGNWIAFDILVIGKADINAWDQDGESLLHKQARHASTTTIATHLLQKGANVEACTSQGYTPLQCAAMSGNRTMFFFLLMNGGKIDVQTPKGESLLHITPPSSQDCLDILVTLLDLGLDPKALCSRGWTPLHQTVFMGTGAPDIEFDKTSEFIDTLLEHGVEIDTVASSPRGETPLHLAIIASIPRPSLVSFLVSRGASVNRMTSEGKTPLHLAAEKGRNSLFRALLAAGADLTIKIPGGTEDGDEEDGGQTPLDIARKHPLGALWFDDTGNLQLSLEQSQCGSLATPIEDIDTESDTDDETGGSTLVEDDVSQWKSVSSTQIVSVVKSTV
ncbi:ankyrin [Aspergillus japonicus CBS 114.51]|uniref:Ankyrin n=1 Tax=Aspergillus japonicus CBS 114.51 TaxID=1448312 RepID=A0A8T8WS51_ASPJA|nr:ankyrin [Aspergillus japonicus CBS 114.51]RAH78500.1 ankyrin [Aspergillus japonicus CBS 114.51]